MIGLVCLTVSNTVEIAPSILAADFASLGDAIRAVERAGESGLAEQFSDVASDSGGGIYSGDAGTDAAAAEFSRVHGEVGRVDCSDGDGDAADHEFDGSSAGGGAVRVSEWE